MSCHHIPVTISKLSEANMFINMSYKTEVNMSCHHISVTISKPSKANKKEKKK